MISESRAPLPSGEPSRGFAVFRHSVPKCFASHWLNASSLSASLASYAPAKHCVRPPGLDPDPNPAARGELPWSELLVLLLLPPHPPTAPTAPTAPTRKRNAEIAR